MAAKDVAGKVKSADVSQSEGVRIVPLQRFPQKGFTPLHGTRSASPGRPCFLGRATETFVNILPTPAGGSLSFPKRPAAAAVRHIDSVYEKYSQCAARSPTKRLQGTSDWRFSGMQSSDSSSTGEHDSTLHCSATERVELVRNQRSTPFQTSRAHRKFVDDVQTMSEPPHGITRPSCVPAGTDTDQHQGHRSLLGQSTSLGCITSNRPLDEPGKTRKPADLLDAPEENLRIDLTVPLKSKDDAVAVVNLDDFDQAEDESRRPCSTIGSDDFRPIALGSAPHLAVSGRTQRLRESDIFLGRPTKRTDIFDVVRNIGIWVLVLCGTGTIMVGVILSVLWRSGSYMFTGSLLGSILTTVGLLIAIYCTDGADKQLRLIGHRCNYN
ncbi:uncharacterized protein LOC135370131 [Ornithodoros turicata]|uniref:uncharacterized protein LOC135370131 n=1 Tax=Ornithodoros turicata TaxID=34597 RepID=UPI0031397017